MCFEIKRSIRRLTTVPRLPPKRAYAEGLCFSKLVWVFYAGSLIGFFWEVLLNWFKHGTIESRAGVLYGPFNPIYGFGFVIIVLCLYRIRNPWLMLLAGAVAGGGFEYLMWFLQKLLLNATSWDYHSPFRFNGVVIFEWLYWGGTSFFHALGWGTVGLIGMRVIYPNLSNAVEEIPVAVGRVLTVLLVGFMVVDCVLTVLALFRQAIRHACEKSGSCREPNALETLLDRLYSDEFMQKVFPNMDIKEKVR